MVSSYLHLRVLKLNKDSISFLVFFFVCSYYLIFSFSILSSLETNKGSSCLSLSVLFFLLLYWNRFELFICTFQFYWLRSAGKPHKFLPMELVKPERLKIQMFLCPLFKHYCCSYRISVDFIVAVISQVLSDRYNMLDMGTWMQHIQVGYFNCVQQAHNTLNHTLSRLR